MSWQPWGWNGRQKSFGAVEWMVCSNWAGLEGVWAFCFRGSGVVRKEGPFKSLQAGCDWVDWFTSTTTAWSRVLEAVDD